MGMNGDGSCECELGYAGPYCNITCPLGPGPSTCAGNGTCLQSDATCVCEKGHAGPNCALACPDVNCTGNGICFDGTYGDGTCNCYKGYIGPACETPCDCEHGTCIPGNSTCICTGNWTGSRCEKCRPGISGPYCNMTCYNGVTNGTNCSCFGDWVMPQCNATCPKDANNATCGGPLQGTCDATTATCSCVLPFKGPSCSCQTQVCRDTCNIDADCNLATGQCMCIGNRDGIATGCDTCNFGFYGPQCTDRCPCSGKGSCNKVTGACSCFSDATNGYWSGVNCDQCFSGFMGARCQQKAITLTVVTSVTYSAAVTLVNQFTYMDQPRMLYYVSAGNLNLIYNVTPTVPQVLLRPGNYFPCDPYKYGGDAGNLVGIRNDTRQANRILYLVGANSSCNIAPVRVYSTPAEPITFLLANTTNRTVEIKNLQDPGTTQYSFMVST
ncbi:MAG: hypothetical protein Q8N51_13510, partial [Gammaproteobacteria bacterium]|nr:hypothetical protein [Gammaproteobacteria bacterium]